MLNFLLYFSCTTVLILSIALVARNLVLLAYTKKTRDYLRKFKQIPDLDCFYESVSKISFGDNKKAAHAVLMLHGYSASTQEFNTLIEALERENVPYYAPALCGHGLTSCRILERVKYSDWLRDGLAGYDILSSIANEVSIVGHSNGGSIATYVASKRKVKYLFLSGPNLVASKHDLRYKKLLNTKVVGFLLRKIWPVFLKTTRNGRIANTDTIEKNAALNSLSYPAMPINSLHEQWKMQDFVNIGEAKYEQLILMYGEHDLTVDMPHLIAKLNAMNITFNEVSFSNSGHNIWEDYDKQKASSFVVEYLSRSKVQ